VPGAVFWVLVALATLTSLATAWALGANSNSPPFAPAIGANAISTMRAAFLIGILAALGTLTQGGAISETVRAGLIDGVQITSLAATAGPLTATGFMAFGVYSGYPVPAAFATTGAMVGVGLSLGGDPAVDTYRRIALFWVLVPPVSGGLAFVTATLRRRDEIPETVGVPLLAAVVTGIIANVRLSIIPSPPDIAQSSIAGFVTRLLETPTALGVDPVVVLVTLGAAAAGFQFIRQRTQQSVDGGIRTFLVVLGSVVAFSSGGSQVGLATGPLKNLYGAELGLPGGRPARARCGRHSRRRVDGCTQAPVGDPASTHSLASGVPSPRWSPGSSSPSWPSRWGSPSRFTTSLSPESSAGGLLAARQASPGGKSA